MLRTDLKHDFVRSYSALLGAEAGDHPRLVALLEAMIAEAQAVLGTEGIAPRDQAMALSLDLRYLGQYHEVPVEVPIAWLRSGQWDAIRGAFHDRHDRLYGYALRDEGTAVQLVSLRLAAAGRTDKPPLDREARAGADARHAIKGSRAVFDPRAEDFADTPVYDGDLLRHGNRLAGPAIVEKVTTTVYVPAAFSLEVDALVGFLLEDQPMRGNG